MPALTRIAERVGAVAGGVDEAARVIRGAVICGFESANRRRYPRAVLVRDCRKYEGAKVHFDHRAGDRSFRDWVGVVENVRPGPDGRPRGDLRLFAADPGVPKLLEAARVCPGRFGLSHVIDARTRREGGVEVVEEIARVESVDIVLDPATNPGGLFEGTGAARAAGLAPAGPQTLAEFLTTVRMR
jgi:hypothetical protein